MKRILTAITVLCIAAIAHADTILPKLSIDFGGNHQQKSQGTTVNSDTETGLAFGAEYLTRLKKPENPALEVGGGIEFQLPRKIKDTGGRFNFTPLYATGYVYPFKKQTDVQPYGRLALGYNLLFSGNNEYAGGATLKGGLFWAFGLGARWRSVMADLSYSSYAGSAEVSDVFFGSFTSDITYTKISLTVGYSFII